MSILIRTVCDLSSFCAQCLKTAQKYQYLYSKARVMMACPGTGLSVGLFVSVWVHFFGSFENDIIMLCCTGALFSGR